MNEYNVYLFEKYTPYINLLLYRIYIIIKIENDKPIIENEIYLLIAFFKQYSAISIPAINGKHLYNGLMYKLKVFILLSITTKFSIKINKLIIKI